MWKWKSMREDAKRSCHSINEQAAKQALVSMIGQNLTGRGHIQTFSPAIGNIITAYGRNLLLMLRDVSADFKNIFSSDGGIQVVYGVSLCGNLSEYLYMQITHQLT